MPSVAESATEALAALFKPGAVVELRAFKGRETVSGYFDNQEELAQEAERLDGMGYMVYVTLNEVNPSLLARAANRSRKVYREPTTSDNDIVHRRLLPLDFDPTRPSGVSATDGEKEAAKLRAREVYEHLKARGWSEPVVGDSGNGYHLLYGVDLSNDAESLTLVRSVLEALAFRFSDEAVEVDTSVFNAARIWKLYGTAARKGDDTLDRPHRRSALLKVPDASRVEVVDQDQLAAVARLKPPPPSRDERRRFDPGRNGHKEFDLENWIRKHDVPVKRAGPWQGQPGGYRYILEECPWNGHTDNAAYIVQHPSGAIAAGCHHNSCQGYGWRELREHYEPGCYERNGTRERANAEAGQEEPDDWEDPAPLPDGLPPVTSFDPAMLPDALRPWCEDIAERMQVPLDYVAIGAVTVAASLVGRKVGIHPKQKDGWFVVVNLWAAIVGPSAAMKSPALAEITKPLDRLVGAAMKAHSEAEESHRAEAEAVEAEKTALKKAIDTAAKKSVETGDRSRLDDLIDRRRNMETSESPTERRYKTSDTTIEKLVEILRDNPTGILIQRDELVGLLRGLDRQGREADRAFYLESWNGTGSYTVDRIGRGTLHVQALCISVLGGIQPGPLRSYVYGATRGGEGADGLLQRFQLLVWPDPPSGAWRNVDRYPDADAKNRAYAVYEALDRLDPEGVAGAKTDDLVEDGGIPAVRFSPDAQEVFDAWRHELEAKLRGEDASEAFVSHLAKYRSLMPSLALIFHLVDAADSLAESSVGVASVTRAAAWCEYLEGHARRVYASGESPALEGARTLLARIRKGDVKDGDKIREVYRGRHWARLSTPEEVFAAATVLEDHGWLRVEKLDTGGRPTHHLRIHPVLKKEA